MVKKKKLFDQSLSLIIIIRRRRPFLFPWWGNLYNHCTNTNKKNSPAKKTNKTKQQNTQQCNKIKNYISFKKNWLYRSGGQKWHKMFDKHRVNDWPRNPRCLQVSSLWTLPISTLVLSSFCLRLFIWLGTWRLCHHQVRRSTRSIHREPRRERE